MLKVKISGVREEVENLIKKAAEHLQFYYPRFPEESQATGYHAFKEMCLMKEQICTLKEFDNHKSNIKSSCPVGFYLISRIHPNAREITIDAVNMVRKVLSEGNASKVKIVNKYR